jgi:hypothetical protein
MRILNQAEGAVSGQQPHHQVTQHSGNIELPEQRDADHG